MDPPIDGGPPSVVRYLVKLPVIDRVKLVKDVVLRELEGIRVQVASLQGLADLLLANQAPLLESSINLVEAAERTRMEVDRQGEIVMQGVMLGRQESKRQLQAVLADLQGVREEAERHTFLLMSAVREAERRVEQRSLELLESLERTREEASRQADVLGTELATARIEASSQMRELHDAIQAELARARSEANSQARELDEAIRAELTVARTEAGDQARILPDVVRAEAGAVLSAVREEHTRAEERIEALAAAIRQVGGDARKDAGLLGSTVRSLQEATQQRVQETVDAAVTRLQDILEKGHDSLRDAVVKSRLEPVDHLQGRVVLLRSGAAPQDPEVDLMGHLYSYLPSRVAVDVGAHVGDVSSRLLDAGYVVYAFEPNAGVFHKLSSRFSRDAQFHAFPWAIGSTDGMRDFHFVEDISQANTYGDPTRYGSLAIHSMPDDLIFTDSAPVTVRSLESLHGSGHVPSEVGLVKVDTEGFDLEVLRGMGHHRYPVVVAEYWGQSVPFGASGALNRLEDMVKEMRCRGYDWYIVFYRIWGKEGTSFYCNREVAIDEAYGNVFFFQDHGVFAHALTWCAAALPPTYLSG